MDQFVVRSEDLPDNDPEHDFGVILPQIVTMGTVTRRAVEPTWLTASNAKKNRIGSELKANVIAPNGYKIVGADVDSQELWISSLLGDAQFGIHGATAFGWMTLQGNKADATDLHSRSAAIIQSSRDHAKVFNYARIYGSGLSFASDLLLKYNPLLTPTEAKARAQKLYDETKGARWYPGRKMKQNHLTPTSQLLWDRLNKPFWFGGSESYMFNALEGIAMSDDPRTPACRVQLPNSLMPQMARKNVSSV
jgi:DNA polymerase gamma 1